MQQSSDDHFAVPVDRFLAEIEDRLRNLFDRYQRGDEVPTGERLRLEGFMEAGIFLGIASRDELIERMDIIYRDVFAESLPPSCHALDTPVIAIPARWERAPVVPTTGS